MRGDLSRGAWLRNVVKSKLGKRVRVWNSPLGKWDRYEKGHLNEKNAKKERAKRKRSVVNRRYREKVKARGTIAKPDRSADEIPLVFHADGTCTAADLDALGASVGWVSEDGIWHQESQRHKERRVARECKKQAKQGELNVRWAKAIERWRATGVIK